MTTVAEHLDPEVPADLDALKAYLGVSGTAEDPRLKLWFASAIRAADKYLEQDFVDADGNDVDPPSSVVTGVYEFVKAVRGVYKRPAGVSSTKTMNLSTTYSDSPALALGYEAAVAFWHMDKADLTTAGRLL